MNDDIIDNSVTRRGQSCWYRREEVGLAAINDAVLVEQSMYVLLKKYFRDKSSYLDLMEVLHDVSILNISLDLNLVVLNLSCLIILGHF